MEGMLIGEIEGTVIGANDIGVMEIGVIDIGVMEIGVIDIGVNVIDGTEGSVTEIGVYVSDPNSVQLKSTQQPWTPLRITQLRPALQ